MHAIIACSHSSLSSAIIMAEVNTTYPDQDLAVATEFLNNYLATLINGLTTVAIVFYNINYLAMNRSVVSYCLNGIPTLLIVVAIIIISLSASGSALIAMVILTMMIIVIGAGSLIFVMTYRLGHHHYTK